jgi:hypothetical protein
MAQDPERDDEQVDDETVIDTSHDLDMVPLYFSQTIEAESEAEVIRGILETNGIPATISSSPVTSLGHAIQVPRSRVDDARRIVEEQRLAGPEAAAEAEAASEEER